MTVLTTASTVNYEDVANQFSYLIEEGETIIVKSYYGKSVYYKADGNMQLRPRFNNPK